MRRAHAVALSLVLAGGSVAGVLAASRTAHLTRTKQSSSRPDPGIAARSRKLDQVEASLHRALASKPPALPRVPRYAPVPIPDLPPLPAAAPAGKVIYVRPKPIVKYVRPAPLPATPAGTGGDGEQGEHGESEPGEGGEHGSEGGSLLADGQPSLQGQASFDGGEE